MLEEMHAAEQRIPFCWRSVAAVPVPNLHDVEQHGRAFLQVTLATRQTTEHIYFLRHYVSGPTLAELSHLQDEAIRFLMAELVLALAALHQAGVLVRDLKPQNVLLAHDGHVLLTDYAISKEGLVASNEFVATFSGDGRYLAPEILEGKGYGKAVDYWSLGVLLYSMYTGSPPWGSIEDVEGLYYRIMGGQFVIPADVPTGAADLIRALLVVDARARLQDMHILMSSSYFRGCDWFALSRKQIPPPLLQSANPRYVPPISISEVPDIDALEAEEVIGQGSWGRVLRMRDELGRLYAMKIVRKQLILARNEMEHTRAERSILLGPTAVPPSNTAPGQPPPSRGGDRDQSDALMAVPQQLEQVSDLHPTIVSVNTTRWAKRHWGRVAVFEEQALARSQCFHLLDALSSAGRLQLLGTQMHVLASATVQFDRSLMETVLHESVDPLEASEKALRAAASIVLNL